MTCGEGGGVAVNDDALAERARCAIDPCHFYWQGRNDAVKPFSGNGARASELMGAMLNVQLDRLDGMVEAMRRERKKILEGIAPLGNLGLKVGADEQPGSRLRDAGDAEPAVRRKRRALCRRVPERDRRQDRPAQLHRMGPGADGRGRRASGDESVRDAGERRMPASSYSKDMCARSLDILNRTVMVGDAPAAHRRRRSPTSSTTSARRRGSCSAGCRRRESRDPQVEARRRAEIRHEGRGVRRDRTKGVANMRRDGKHALVATCGDCAQLRDSLGWRHRKRARAEDKPLSIYFVGCAAPTGFHGYLARGAAEAGKNLGVKVTYIYPDQLTIPNPGREDRRGDRGEGERHRALRISREDSPYAEVAARAKEAGIAVRQRRARRPRARRCAIPTTSSCSAPDRTRRRRAR